VIRALLFAALAAAPLVAAPFARARDASADRDLAAACAICHGTDGRSAGGIPALAGMAREDMIRKLNDFRSGAAHATVMHQIAKGYSEDEIRRLAAYFASLKR